MTDAEHTTSQKDDAAASSDTKDETTSSPTPIFGAGFSNSTGFGGFTGVTPPAATDGDDDDEKSPEEDCKAEFKPIVQLDEVEATTGEEGEDCLLELCASSSAKQSAPPPSLNTPDLAQRMHNFYAVLIPHSQKAKLYRYEQENNQWKERGIGQAKFLESKDNKKIRFLMRQEKTLKIRANHLGATEFKNMYEKAMERNAELLKADGVEVAETDTGEGKAKAEEAADELADKAKVTE